MKALKLSIYEEHLEETAFLYDYRKRVLSGAAYDMDDVAAIDERLAAHIDGLLLGGDLALGLCQERAASGEAGELYGALCVYSQAHRVDLISALLHAVDEGDEERLQVMRDAAAREFTPPFFTSHVTQWLNQHEGAKAAMLAHAVGVGRIDTGPVLSRSAQKAKDEHAAPFLRAIGRAGAGGTGMLLFKYMQMERYETAREGAVASLLLGDVEASAFVSQHAGGKPWAAFATALVGRGKWSTLERFLQCDGEAAKDAALGIGLLGDPESLGLLLDLLGDDALAAEAATALYLMTGAALVDEPAPPPPEPPSTGEQDEGNAPADNASEAEGSADDAEDDLSEEPNRFVSADRGVWAQYLSERTKIFAEMSSLRAGAPYDPRSSLKLLSMSLPLRARRWLVDELAIRHQIHVRDISEWSVTAALASFARANTELNTRNVRSSRSRPSPPER